ncbi:MAG TPA: nucleotide exchange factor GrpE [Longimicrobium sp.]|nr:nucleotide exchange factor GrpE [Longimicrobium sp.]
MTDPWLEERAAAVTATSQIEVSQAGEEPGTAIVDADDDSVSAHTLTTNPVAAAGSSAGSMGDGADGASAAAAAGDARAETGPDTPSAGVPDLAPGGDAPFPAGSDALLAAVRELEAHVSAQAGRVLQAFGDKLAYDAFKEEQVARLHAELLQHREGMLERVTHPLLNAVIRVHDNLGKVAASLRARPPEELTPERTFRVLDGFREDLELLLSQHGVEPFEPVDDVFDPRLHLALRTVQTDDPHRAGRIAERLRPGFSHGQALLQKARVAVFTAYGTTPASHPTASTRTPANGGEG